MSTISRLAQPIGTVAFFTWPLERLGYRLCTVHQNNAIRHAVCSVLPSGRRSIPGGQWLSVCQDYETATACLLDGYLPQLLASSAGVAHALVWQSSAAIPTDYREHGFCRLRYTEPLELLQLLRGVLAEATWLL